MKVEGVVNSKVYLIRHNFKREIIINKKNIKLLVNIEKIMVDDR